MARRFTGTRLLFDSDITAESNQYEGKKRILEVDYNKSMEEQRRSFKDMLIVAFHQLLCHNVVNVLSYIVICYYETYLILTFLLWNVSQNSSFGNFQDVIDSLNPIYYVLRYLSLTGFYVISLLVTLIQLCLPIALFCLLPSQNAGEHKSLGYCRRLFFQSTSLYVTLLIRALCIPLFWMYMALFDCSHELKEVYPEVQCWQGEHLAYGVVNSVGLGAMLLALGVSVYLQPSDCYPESTEPWAGTISYIGLPRAFVKLIVVVLRPTRAKYGIAIGLAYFFFAFQRASCKQYIYNQTVYKHSIISDCVIAIYALGVSIGMYLSLDPKLLGVLIFGLFSLVFSLCLLTYKDICAQEVVDTPILRLKDINSILLCFMKAMGASKNVLKSAQDRMVLWSVLCNHQRGCPGEPCECRVIEAKLKEVCKAYLHVGQEREEEVESLKYKHTFTKKLLSILLKDALDRNRESVDIRLLASYIEDRKVLNFIKGYFNIMKAEEYNPSLAGDLAIAIHRRAIERNILARKQDKGLDVRGIWLFEKHYQTLLKDIGVGANKCVEFWTELLQVSVNVGRLYKKSIKIAELYLTITSKVTEMLAIYPDHTALLRDYAQFLTDIVNNDVEAAEYAEKSMNAAKISAIMKADNNDENIKFGHNSATVTLAISGNIGTTGIILNTNDKIAQFGYTKNQVLGKNVSILLPQYLGAKHDSFIFRYFDTGNASMLNKERVLFVLDKSGYIVPIYILVKCIPDLQEGLCFMGFLKRLAPDAPYLQAPAAYGNRKFLLVLTDSQGHFLGFSRACFKKFGFVMSLVYAQSMREESSFSIRNMNPDLLEPKCESKLVNEGMELVLKTESILQSVELERLSQTEAAVIARTAGSYMCYVQLIKHDLYNVSFRIYKIALLMRKQTLKCSSLLATMHVDDSFRSEERPRPINASEVHDGKESKDVQAKAGKEAKELKDLKDLKDGKERHNAELFMDSVHDSSTLFGSVTSTSSQFSKVIKEFKRKICNEATPKTISFLNRAVILLLLLLIALAIFDLVMRITFSNNFMAEIKAISLSNNRRFLISDVVAKFRSIVDIAADIETSTYAGNSRLTRLVPGLEQNLVELKEIQDELDKSTFDITDTLKTLVKTRCIPMVSLDAECKTSSVNVSMSIAIGQIIMYASMILNSDLKPLRSDPLPQLHYGMPPCTRATLLGRGIYFVLENAFKDLRRVCLEAGEHYIDSAMQNADRDEMYLLILMAFSIVFVLLCTIIVIPILVRTDRNKIIALAIFAQLPTESAEQMLLKCRKFFQQQEAALGYSQSLFAGVLDKEHENRAKDAAETPEELKGEAEDKEDKEELVAAGLNNKEKINKVSKGESTSGEEKKDEQTPLLDVKVNDKKALIGHEEAFRKFRTNLLRILLVLFIFTGAFLGYIGLCYYLSSDVFSNSRSAFEQVGALTGRNPALVLSLSFLRELYIRNSSYIHGPQDLLKTYLDFLTDREHSYSDLKAKPSAIIARSVRLLRRIDSSEFCTLATAAVGTAEELKGCLTIEGGLLRNGLKNAIYNYISLIISSRETFYRLGARATAATLKSVLNNDDHISTLIVKDRYINPAMWTLQQHILQESNEYYDSIKTIDIIKFVVFVVAIILLMTIIWTSFISNLKREVFRARGILNLIPTDFILNNDVIKKEVLRIISF